MELNQDNENIMENEEINVSKYQSAETNSNCKSNQTIQLEGDKSSGNNKEISGNGYVETTKKTNQTVSSQSVQFARGVKHDVISTLRIHGVHKLGKLHSLYGKEPIRQGRIIHTPKQAFKMIAKSSSSIAEQIKQRGQYMVEDTALWENPVKIDFNIDRNIMEFNIRERVTTLLEKMKTIDKKMKIKSTIDDTTEWKEINEIPEDEEFNTHFQTKEYLYRRARKSQYI